MWRMLAGRAADLRVESSAFTASDTTGSAHWEAWYTFTATGRPVHNVIDAEFAFAGGGITRHVDRFDLYRWSRQALGARGVLLGMDAVRAGRHPKAGGRGSCRIHQEEWSCRMNRPSNTRVIALLVIWLVAAGAAGASGRVAALQPPAAATHRDRARDDPARAGAVGHMAPRVGRRDGYPRVRRPAHHALRRRRRIPRDGTAWTLAGRIQRAGRLG